MMKSIQNFNVKFLVLYATQKEQMCESENCE
jgi:hypothetical protein